MANILVVDDDEDVRLLQRTLLGGRGHAVTEAEDGKKKGLKPPRRTQT